MNSFRLARIRAGLTLAELSAKAGVSPDAISTAERGIRDPQATTVHRLARALNVDPADLLAPERVAS